jgi:HlyD family secretion protein
VAVVLAASFLSLRKNPVPVQSSRAVRRNLTSTVATNGKISPIDNFEAHAGAPATVKRVLVHEGDRVRAGQLLVQLDGDAARAQAAKARAQVAAAAADLHAIRSGGTQEELLTAQAQVTKAQAAVDNATRNLEALRRLEQAGAASAGEVAAAETRLQAAQTDWALAKEKKANRYSAGEIERVEAQAREAQATLAAAANLLQHTDLRAPYDAIVYSVPVRNGEYVSAGEMLVQAADLRQVRVVGYVDEPDVARLRPGQAVQVTWDAIPGRSWRGALKTLPASIVPLGTRNVGQIICQVDNPDLVLLPNVNVGVDIIVAQAQDVLVVPRESVHEEGGQQFVYEITKGKLQRRNVQTGISTLTQIEITHGVPEGAEVALETTNGQPLRDGMQVQVAGP